MFDTIMVPLDGSELAEQAIGTARALAIRYRAGLWLAHVHEPTEPIVLDDMPAIDEELRSMTRQHEQTYLERLAREAAPDGQPPTEVVLLDGPVARALGDFVEQHGVDLVVMTTHGRTGFERAWLGSTTDALSRSSSAALLVLRPRVTPPLAFQHILVPLDGSAEGERVLPFVRALAGPEHATVSLLCVVPSSAGVAEHERAAAYLDRIAGRMRDEAVAVNVEVRDGPAASTILQAARDVSCDLLAFTSHGQSGFVEQLMGSTADKVLRGADRPVLLVRRH